MGPPLFIKGANRLINYRIVTHGSISFYIYLPMRKQELTQGHKVILFIAYTAGMYVCNITASIFEEKLYKVPYPRNSNPVLADLFTDKITPLGVTAGVACLIGFLFAKNQQLAFNIPILKLAKVAACDTITHVCLISALILTNYTTYIIVNTLSLISVILVGSYCTGVKYDKPEEGEEDISDQPATVSTHSQKIGPEKLWIGAIICTGIIVFSIFGSSDQKAAETARTAGTAVIVCFLFGVALTLEGFRPDFMAQIKQQYRPSSLFLYFSVNGVIFLLVIFSSLVTWNIKYFVQFALNHERLLLDLGAFSLLSALGGIFGYRLVNTFRQHIYPLVSNTRKCLTVCINVAWYGHHLAKMQWLGILIVFSGIMVEIINNYNLANKLLSNYNVCHREGQNYNKVITKDQELNTAYEPHISEGVEGI